jgi:hypothetical protein
MRRLLLVAVSAAVLMLTALVPVALAAGPDSATDGVVIAINGTVDVPAGGHRDAVVVIDGTATIAGDVDTVVVAGGSATLSSATVRSLVVIDGSAVLGTGTTVTGDVSTLNGSVAREAGATVLGETRALDRDLAAFAILMIPLIILLAIGFGVAAVAAALVVATFAARQVRDLETLISTQPGPVLVSGLVGAVALPILGVLLVMTVIGAPVGLGLLVVVLPALAFLGWLVAAIWVGDWLVARMRGQRETGRPYVAAVLGVIALSIAGMLPFVSGIATLFGFGALVLTAWRTARPESQAPVAAAVGQPMPSAG